MKNVCFGWNSKFDTVVGLLLVLSSCAVFHYSCATRKSLCHNAAPFWSVVLEARNGAARQFLYLLGVRHTIGNCQFSQTYAQSSSEVSPVETLHRLKIRTKLVTWPLI
jgi:hypothetical protein